MHRLRASLPAVILGCGCLLISNVREQRTMAPVAPLTVLPPAAPGYEVREVSIADNERQVAGMSHYSMRTYTSDSLTDFSVYVGYYDRQGQGKTIHSPKNCLPGAGWETLTGGTRTITTTAGRQVEINRFILMNGASQALVYYWYQGRGRVESNEYTVKWDLLRDAALLGRTEEALVRIVVVLPPGEQGDKAGWDAKYAATDRLAESVAQRLVEDVERVLPPRRGAGSSTNMAASEG